MKKVLLIDGDVVAFKIAVIAEKPIHWGDDIWTMHCDVAEARGQTDAYIHDLMVTLKADECKIALSDMTNFRKLINPEYKANRKGKRKPMCFPELKLWMRVQHGAKILPTLEADDVIGMWGTEETTEDRIIVSIDKDFQTIPCKRYNPDKPELGILSSTKEEANYFHYIQTLAGDSVDGYKGVPKVGPKTAEKILKGKCDWEKVLECYEEYGMTEEDALMNARMAYILRDGDYRHREGATLWHPEKSLG